MRWQVHARRGQSAGIIKRATPHTLRHAFVTYGLRCNDIKTMMDLVGHEDPNTQ